MKPPAGRILAVDPGTVRIGLAVSDELGVSLTPLEVVEGRAAGEERVAEIAVHEGVAAVVVGLPLNMTGTAGREAAKARRFAAVLAGLLDGAADVYLQDERLTSYEAEGLLARAGRRPSREKGRVDLLSAQLILRGFLDGLRAGRECEKVQSGETPGEQ